MAGLKKARKAAEKAAAAKKAKQQYQTSAPQQAPAAQPRNPFVMTTSDMAGGNTER